MYDEAMNMFELSFKNALTIRDDVTAAYSKYNIALIDLYEKRFQKAEAAFVKLSSNPDLPELLRTETDLQLSKIQLHHHKDPGKALQYVNRYINELDYPSGAGYSIKADAFYAAESYDSAYHYYLLSLKCDTELSTESNDYSHLPELSLMLGHEDSTLYYMDRYKECLETQYERYNQSAITAIQMRHNLEKFDMLHKEEMKRYLILTTSIVSVALLILVLLYMYQENRRRRRYEQLCDSLIRRQIEDDIPEDSLENALESSRSLFLNSVGHTMLQELSVVDRIPESSELSVIRHNTELYFEKPMAIMKAEVPSLSQTEVMYCIYRYLGVNWRLCMELIHRSPSYSGRLKQYILKKIPSEWNRMLFQN